MQKYAYQKNCVRVGEGYFIFSKDVSGGRAGVDLRGKLYTCMNVVGIISVHIFTSLYVYQLGNLLL